MRLRSLQPTIDDLITKSTLPVGFVFVADFVGLINLSLVRPRTQSPIGYLLMTNFPTPDITSTFFGNKVVYMRYNIGFAKKGCPIGIHSISFQGKLML
jgi:hypothetical protein